VTSVEVRVSETESGWRQLAADFSRQIRVRPRRRRRGLTMMVALVFALPLFAPEPPAEDPAPLAAVVALPNAVPPHPAPKQPLHKRLTKTKKLKKKKR
jgi:hypothetical protein